MKVRRLRIHLRNGHDLVRSPHLCAALVALSISMPATAQELCDESLIAPRGSPWGYRLRGDRCEGIYVEELASTTLQIASLVESFEDYDPTAARDLRVVWTAPGDGAVRLRALGLKRHLHYRMDTIVPSGRASYEWPTGILAPLKIHRQDVGVLAWIEWQVGATKQRVYLPLRICQQRSPVPSGSYRLVLMLGRQASEVYVHLVPVGSDGRLGTYVRSGEPLRYGHYPAGRSIVVPISGPERPGVYYLEIGADLAGGGLATTQLYFYADR